VELEKEVACNKGLVNKVSR